ncbi:MAG: amino acid permease [Candidatus Ancillula sp.]|jgi:D-serine/D-alanine/glycine transporter|nr:amino acid permease [Candidatus Ancillula sp.]
MADKVKNIEKPSELQRDLKNRHIQLISIGGVIGTGLFLGSGKSIAMAGPSILLTYLIVGIFVFFIVRALGELLMSNLKRKSFLDFVDHYLGHKTGFITGWTYWFAWVALGATDLTATGMYMKFWAPDLPQWLPEVVAILILLAINLSAVKYFGEIEFWFALIKVVAVIALIIVGAIIIFANIGNGTSDASITNLWQQGGFFTGGWSGFLLSFQIVTFAFVGVEVIGVIAGEAEKPERNIPKAINNVPLRVGIFYIGALLVIMCVHPWSVYKAGESPFVEVFSQAGVTIAASIINFVVLTAAASACNSALYSSSRMLTSLSDQNNAPKAFSVLTRHGTPKYALFTCAGVVFSVIILNIFVPSRAFDIASSLSTICFVFVWCVIIITHMVYRKQTPKEKLGKFRMPLYPYSSYAIFVFIALVTVVMLFIVDTLIALIILPIFLVILYVAYHFYHRNKSIEK